MKTIILLSLLLMFFSIPITAQELVTRDDFICYDTTDEYSNRAFWPSIALNSNGSLNQINVNWGAMPCSQDCDKLFYSRFDKYGNQFESTFQILPDTVHPDTIWRPAGWTFIYCNDNYVYIPYLTSRTEPEDKQNMIIFDKNQNYSFERVCVDCDPEYLDYSGSLSIGSINKYGRALTTWAARPDAHTYADSVYLKYYDIPDKFLSPMITPSKMPHPPNESGYGNTQEFSVHSNPTVGVADNGSFVSVWSGNLGPYSHIFYLLYDSTSTPFFDTIRIADCDEGFMPPGICRSDWNVNVDVAMEPDGDFYITWCGYPLTDDFTFAFGERIYVRGFYTDGTPKYGPVCVTDTDSLYIWYGGVMRPMIACDSIGNILIMWSDSRFYPESNTSRLKSDVFAQKIDNEGNLIGYNFRINNHDGIAGLQEFNYENDMNDAGQAVLIWHSNEENYKLWAQLMPYENIGQFVPGDINYDLEVGISDLTTLVDYLFLGGKNTFWPRDLIDLNGDGTNGTISDFIYLVDYLFLSGTQPHTPNSGIRPEFEW